MGKRKSNGGVLKNIVGIIASNISTVVSGIIIGFIIPKVISVEGFGLFKTFSLYITYVGLFSMGIIDGIVLKYGDKDYEQYDAKLFRSYFRWYFIIHIFWVICIILSSFFFHDGDHKFIILMVAVYLLFSNIVGYYQQISQITQRFKEYSVAKILQSIMKILGGLMMIAIYFGTKNLVDYRVYISFIVLGIVIVCFGYLIIYRDITFGKATALNETRKEVIDLSKTGFPLMFANLCATLILTLDRQFVNIIFTRSEYAVYAFAYNMLSLVTVATSAISTVLYPILKRTTKETLKKNYSDLISIMLVFVYGALIVYFPLCAFIRWFLPKYTDSLVIFRVIFPGLAISSSVTVVMHNYYKTLGDNIKYFKKSILILLLSAAANGVAYIIFRTTVSISVASIVTMIVWYLYVEQYFVQNFGYPRWKNFCYLMLMMGCFYGITLVDNLIVSGFLYAAGYGLITLLIEWDIVRSAKSFLKK